MQLINISRERKTGEFSRSARELEIGPENWKSEFPVEIET